jgi:hypothetical protein
MSEEIKQEETKEVINHWDRLVIQLENGEEYSGKVSMLKEDIDNIGTFHGMSRGEVIDMLIIALETTAKEDISNT